jgi:RNA polymerase sigma-70 factor (ECF subfamily)
MREQDWLAERFETQRVHLQAVAYRLLGSLSEADDAVQEAWIRLSRTDTSSVENLGGWLTTVVARVCLDMLRSRQVRREEPLETDGPESTAHQEAGTDPEQETLLADAVGLALLVVLDRLAPAERLAFVLHDLFGVPFDEIAPIVERTPAAARQLASRARRRVQGAGDVQDPDRARQREVVAAFLAASRNGDFEALLALLDPDVVVRADRVAVLAGAEPEVRGATTVARAYLGRAQTAQPVLVNGAVGAVVAPRGRLLLVLEVTFAHGKIAAISTIRDPDRLRQMDLAMP